MWESSSWHNSISRAFPELRKDLMPHGKSERRDRERSWAGHPDEGTV